MRRIFNLFRKEVNPGYYGFAGLTIRFNEWVSQNYQFKAYTNKFMIRKWMGLKNDLPF